MKTGYSCDPDTTTSYCPLFFFEKGKIGAFFLIANIIQVAPECRDIGGLSYLYHGTFGQNAYFHK
jgi:hypothetical protein